MMKIFFCKFSRFCFFLLCVGLPFFSLSAVGSILFCFYSVFLIINYSCVILCAARCVRVCVFPLSKTVEKDYGRVWRREREDMTKCFIDIRTTPICSRIMYERNGRTPAMALQSPAQRRIQFVRRVLADPSDEFIHFSPSLLQSTHTILFPFKKKTLTFVSSIFLLSLTTLLYIIVTNRKKGATNGSLLEF